MRIQRYLKGRGWINGGEIERLAISVGYKGSTASRILRQLAEDNILETRYDEKGVHSVFYRTNENLC